jgi:putative ABC transport system permease protein
MTACYLIFLYVNFELSYDNFHTKEDRIYRVVADIKTPTETINGRGPSWAVPPHLSDFPEVESAVRVLDDIMLFRKDGIKINETEALWADADFFSVFDYKLLKGNPLTVLKDPFSIVLSESSAKKYFGDNDPIGQTILITDDAYPSTITGIMEDIPENSQIQGNVLISMTTITKKFAEGVDDQWGNYGPYAYILLKPGTDAENLERKFPAFLEKWNGKGMSQSQMYPTLLLEPLKDVYLKSNRGGFVTGNINNVYTFSIIAFLILLIACINFINLTTARSSERAKEVGIRKVVGAAKFQLARQFIGESILICLIAFLLTLVVSSLLLPSFNLLSGKIISQGIFENLYYLFLLFLASIGIGLVAGIYPALVLSSFKPTIVLKGRFATGTKGNFLRKGLVISQFTISIVLIIGTIVVYSQMNYMRNLDLGFKKDQILVLDTNSDKNRDALKLAISKLPNIKAVSLSSSVPGGGNPAAYSEIENVKGDLQIANLDLYFVDFDYIPLFNIQVAAGRPFSREFKTDTTQAMVLNEAAVKMFGYSSPEQAIGKRFKQWGREGKIIGVIKDFHFQSLKNPIKPLSMRIDPDRGDYLSISVSASNITATMAAVKKEWKKIIPNKPLSYYFLDEFFNRQYKGEEQFGKLFFNFALLAIFLSCLGLLGLTSYTTMQRTKEIGIRKVMGASVSNILYLLSRDFLKLVVISFFVAAPLSWYVMQKWLIDFAYRTTISWKVFLVAGVIAMFIAIITVSFQALKAAISNPVNSLRTE